MSAILVRHTEVHSRYRGICYGVSDVLLSEDGRAQMDVVAAKAAELSPEKIVHSGLGRTRQLAEKIADRVNIPTTVDERFQELDFGDWELRNWDDISAEWGEDMNRMITTPDAAPPHGGETVAELQKRVLAGLRAQNPDGNGPLLIVSHGGPISALLGTLRSLPVPDWPTCAPGYGAIIELTHEDVDVLINAA